MSSDKIQKTDTVKREGSTQIRQATRKDYFLQDSPRYGNQYLEDTALQSILKRLIPAAALADMELDLTRFGDRIPGDVGENHTAAQDPATYPHLVHHNGWGERVDDIRCAAPWYFMSDVSAEEGIIATGYERKHGKFSRVHQYAKLYMFGSYSALFNCPLAMTDGAAKLIEVLVASGELPAATKDYLMERYAHLTSRDPAEFWTSGQWMTERPGGSDISGTETTALQISGDRYVLHGYKYFTSATTSQMTFTLARIVGPDGRSPAGSAGLSLFQVDLRKPDGSLNNIVVHRLKDKLGTKTLPTAELELIGTPALLCSKPGRGVKAIAAILNITRIHQAVASVGGFRKIVALARDYSHRRSVFGSLLSNNHLHLSTLARQEVELRGLLQLTMFTASLLGEAEAENSERADSLLRILTPITKLYVAKQSVKFISDGLEMFGGAGYMEDTHIPTILRDAQVGTIWEGTTNVLAHDLFRAIQTTKTCLPLFFETAQARLSNAKTLGASPAAKQLREAVGVLVGLASGFGKTPKHLIEAAMRKVAFSFARVYTGTLLLEHAEWSKEPVDAEIFNRWVNEEPLLALSSFDDTLEFDRLIALDINKDGEPKGFGNVDHRGQPRARL